MARALATLIWIGIWSRALWGVPDAGATVFRAEGWSADWTSGSGFTEDFEDGVLDPMLSPFCGSLAPGDESGGVLTLRRPSFEPGCAPQPGIGQQAFSWFFADQGELTARATYRFRAPGVIGEGYGVAVGTVGAIDFLSLGVFIFQNGPTTQLSITLFDENISGLNFLEQLVLPGSAFELDFETVELELVLTEVGAALLPHGRVSFDGGPFQDLGANDFPGVPADGGALQPGDLHFTNLFGLIVPEPGTAVLLAAGLAGLAARSRKGRRDA